jgi:hypothetical protein
MTRLFHGRTDYRCVGSSHKLRDYPLGHLLLGSAQNKLVVIENSYVRTKGGQSQSHIVQERERERERNIGNKSAECQQRDCRVEKSFLWKGSYEADFSGVCKCCMVIF